LPRKKGKLREIISKAKFHEDISYYSVSYRDFNNVITVPLKKFLKDSENLETIPVTRIIEIRKNSQVLYRKLGSA